MTTNPIFHYRASDELQADAWGELVKATAVLADVGDLKSTFKVWEDEFKSTVGMPLPAAWRSAKSVIINAAKHGILVQHPDGSARGKSAVEADIKAAKERLADDAPDVSTQWVEKLGTLIQWANKHGIDWKTEFTNAVNR